MLTFLSECNTYIWLNTVHFLTDSIKIWQTIQLCSGKAANWKRIQLDQVETPHAKAYHTDWSTFQEHFKLKWGNMNTKEKAQQWFFTGLKQTRSICQ